MKNMKKLFALLVAVVMVFAMTTVAFAQSVDSEDGGTATITVSNAYKGVTYKVVKVFDATVGTGNAIAYTAQEIPQALQSVFEKDAAGNVKVIAGKSDKEVTDTVAAWAATQDATAEAESDGSELTFTGLKYGYYAVTTTPGANVSVDSTNPNATVEDKNTTEPTITKTANDKNVAIGDKVTYTVVANTANYLDIDTDPAEDVENLESQIVTKYVIEDTLPAFLKDVTVDSIIIDEDGNTTTKDDQTPVTAQFVNKKIEIDWAKVEDDAYTSLYANGAQIIITYTATVTPDAAIDGAGNKNTVELIPYVDKTPDDDDDPKDPWKDSLTDDEIIYTYAAALQKVDENKKPLAGAKFSALGLTVTGNDGVYTVVSYDPDSTTDGTEMVTDKDGQLVVLGLPTDKALTVKETEAPAGYNKLVDTTTMQAVETGEEIKTTTTTIYYDKEGKVTDETTEVMVADKNTYNVELLKKAVVVVNHKGTELPSTGGIGTTIFYVVGGLLVVGAAIVLISKKRMSKEA